jgi:predicted RNA-binding Zn-ribbon protein involved in translation (DUF1610 family)
MRIYIPRNEADYLRQYGSEAACQRRVYELRRGTPFECPQCRSKFWREMKRSAVGGRPETWHRVCRQCGWQERPLAGTWLHRLRIRLQDFCKICWLAAGSREGFDVRLLRGQSARRLVLDLGSNRTYYRSVNLVRQIMAASQPKLEGKLELELLELAHPQARTTNPKKVVAVLVETAGMNQVRTGVLPDTSTASLKPWLALVSANSAKVTKPRKLIRAQKVFQRLEQWLTSVGWNIIDSRNLPGYLTEFEWRQNGRGTQGSRFVQLLRSAQKRSS